MNNAFISVIIPCFNHGKFLLEAIDSVLFQTYQNFEIIVINDGSTDISTNQIIDKISIPKVKTITTKNQGLAAARNAGIKNANSDIIVTLDADDMFEATFFEKALSVLNANPTIGIVSSYTQTFGFGIPKINRYSESGGVEKFVGARNNAVACAMYRKKCWGEVGGYDEKMKQGFEDWDFWIRITYNGWKIHIINEPLFKYRQHESSMFKQTQKIRVDIMDYIIEKNANIFKCYFKEAIISREKWNLEVANMYHWALDENKRLNEEISKLKQSSFYKLSALFYKLRKKK